MIPKILHQIWIGNTPPPERCAAYTARWKELHPDWEYRLWTDDNRPVLENEEFWNMAPHNAGRSDLLRYEILRKHGGLYVDVDFEPIKNVEPLLRGEIVMAYENPRHLMTGFMACVPGSLVMDRIVKEIPRVWQPYVFETVPSGPEMVDRLRRDRGFDISITKILPGLVGANTPDSYAVHRSLASWAPSRCLVHRARNASEFAWGSHLPLLAGIWRRVPGEIVVEAGLGPNSTHFFVDRSLQYTGIETDVAYHTWGGIEFRNEPHVQFPSAFLPTDIPFHRGECRADQVELMDRTFDAVSQHCPPRIDFLMVDCFGAARASAIKALARRATTVVMHDTECWDGYGYPEVLKYGPWRHRISLRPQTGLPWTDLVTRYAINAPDVLRSTGVCAKQYWPNDIKWEVVEVPVP